MPPKLAEIEQRLKTKFGFSPARNSRHHQLVLEEPGLPPVRTSISHDKMQEPGRKLESLIARELHVSTQFFRDMIGCTESREAYLEQLTTNPQPPFSKGR